MDKMALVGFGNPARDTTRQIRSQFGRNANRIKYLAKCGVSRSTFCRTACGFFYSYRILKMNERIITDGSFDPIAIYPATIAALVEKSADALALYVTYALIARES